MTNYKPKHGDMELWLICAAIKGDNDKIKSCTFNISIVISTSFLKRIAKTAYKQVNLTLQIRKER